MSFNVARILFGWALVGMAAVTALCLWVVFNFAVTTAIASCLRIVFDWVG